MTVISRFNKDDGSYDLNMHCENRGEWEALASVLDKIKFTAEELEALIRIRCPKEANETT